MRFQSIEGYRMIRVSLLTVAMVVQCNMSLWAADWTQFRGPDGLGHSAAKNVPATWSETENIAWKTAIPGLGWSSPSIQGQQIWLTSATDDGRSLRAICVDRASGVILHDVEVFKLTDPGSIHSNNSHASPTPVVEGDRVFVHFGAHGTACLTTDGQIVWKTQELKYAHGHGPGGSPVLWKDLLLVNCDGTDVQYVAALDKRSGAIRWKTERRHIGEKRRSGELQVPMAYCTPLLIDIDGSTQLVSLGSDSVVAYEPATGEEIWWFSFNGYSNVSRPVYGKGMLFFSSGFGEPVFYGIRLGGRGDVTESNSVWSDKKAALVPMDVSPLLVGDELYIITDAGIATCRDAATGKQRWLERLDGKFWASPVFADGKIFCLDEQAQTFVLSAGPKFEQLAANKLDGTAQASPAIVDGAIFLRTATHLYRIEKPLATAAK
jgi:outer membrane protein assembly factor BamB